MTIDQSQAPYFDDYDRSKRFYKVLFKPSKAVQVRELNTLQEILQNQIAEFGSHVFKNGSMVEGGEVNFDLNVPYVKIDSASSFESIGLSVGGRVVGQTSGVEADVIGVSDVEDSDPITLYVQYTSGGTNGENDTFVDGEDLDFYDADDVLQASIDGTVQANGTGLGSTASINDGVYFVNDRFILVDPQTIILDKYGVTPTYKIGMTTTEVVVNSVMDATLLDNANGSFNEQADGADRLRVDVVLSRYETTDNSDDDFIELLRLESGELVSEVRTPSYDALADTLARRTDQINGDFIVDKFNLTLREHLDDGTNSGEFTVGNGGDESKYVAVLDPGMAYVNGYSIETVSNTQLTGNKARSTDRANGTLTNMVYDNYIVVENMNVIPNIDIYEEIEFYDGPLTGAATISGSKVGTARIRNIEYDSGTLGTAGAKFKLYIFNIRNAAGEPDTSFLGDVESVVHLWWGADVSPDARDIFFFPGRSQRMYFRLPKENVKTLKDDQSAVDSIYVVSRLLNLTADGSGDVTYSLGSDEYFENYSKNKWLLSATTSSNDTIDLDGKVSITGGSQSLTISLGGSYANEAVRLVAPILRSGYSEKTKTLTQVAENGVSLTDRQFKLDKADCWEIVSIIDNDTAEDITNRFTLDSGWKENYYDRGTITLKDGYPLPATDLDVTYKYFEHGAGDFFSVDSYADIDYDELPTVVIGGEEVSVAEIIDFRPRVQNGGADFEGAGGSTPEVPQADSNFFVDFDYYLPRKDIVYLTDQGDFGIVEGNPALEPAAPQTPENSLLLYVLDVPAYTFNVDEIDWNEIEAKHYTMGSIAALEKRLENIEYYTLLSLLEQDVVNKDIKDSAGLDRFKNGFMTDNFTDFDNADESALGFKCAIDPNQGILRPELNPSGSSLNRVDASSGVAIGGSVITLDYNFVDSSKNDQASEWFTVNPNSKHHHYGHMTISPDVDVLYNNTRTQIVNTGKTTKQPYYYTQRYYTYNLYQYSKPIKYLKEPIRVRKYIEVPVKKRVIIRETLIDFKATGLKPNTRVYPFFDNQEVSAHCKEDGDNYGDALITDNRGRINGVFRIPSDFDREFRGGSRTFVLTSSSTNAADAVTRTKAIFNAKDRLSTSVSNQITTKQNKSIAYGIQDLDGISFNETVAAKAIVGDPIAQSFKVRRDGGEFIPAIDLYFRQAGDKPITLQLREVKNGKPSNLIYSSASCTLNPEDISTSGDASVPTRFTFEYPVHVKDNTEVCWVLSTNSSDYQVFTSKLGKSRIDDTGKVSKLPNVGVMFLSNSVFGWNALSDRDVMFKAVRADFITAGNPYVRIGNADPDKIAIPEDAVLTSNASFTATINIPNHGLWTGNSFEIEGAVGGNGIADGTLNTTHTVVTVVNQNNVTVTLGEQANADGYIGGSAMKADHNIQFNEAMLHLNNVGFAETSLVVKTDSTQGSSMGNEAGAGAVSADNPANTNEPVRFSGPMVLYNPAEDSNGSFFARCELDTSASHLSPVIDLDGSALDTIENVVNNPTTLEETDANSEGNGAYKYITKPASLSLPATSLKLFIDVNKPVGAGVHIFYRVSDDINEIKNVDWSELSEVSVAGNNDDGEFYENEYGVDDIGEFTVYQIKIVGVADSSSAAPMFSALRLIALGT